jgi:hypothetical protein
MLGCVNLLACGILVTSTLSATRRRWAASSDRIVDKYCAITWATLRSWLWGTSERFWTQCHEGSVSRREQDSP